jgi:glycosyltransferase involved in cell wall biosynthesis
MWRAGCGTLASTQRASRSFMTAFPCRPNPPAALAMQAAATAGVNVRVSTDLAVDLPRARALIYLTRSEGLGSGILLAMAYGVTVIASDVGGIPELIRDGQNGILVPNDAGAVARALGSIDPALGRAARATVIERFSEQHMVDATLAAYLRVQAHA